MASHITTNHFTMKLSLAYLLLTTTGGGGVWAFAPPRIIHAENTRRMMSSLPPAEGGDGSSSGASTKKVLTAADVVARSKAQGTLPGTDGDEEYPKLFTKEIYDDFQSALLKLEKRVKDGPGSLSKEEIDAFQGEADRIVEEMRLFLNNPEERKKEIEKSYGNDTTKEDKGEG